MPQNKRSHNYATLREVPEYQEDKQQKSRNWHLVVQVIFQATKVPLSAKGIVGDQRGMKMKMNPNGRHFFKKSFKILF